MTLQIPAYTLDILHGNEAVTTALLVAFAVGVGIGSLLCERMSGHRIELGLVPFGSIGLTLFAIDLFFAQPTMHADSVDTIGEFIARDGSIRILFDFGMLGALRRLARERCREAVRPRVPVDFDRSSTSPRCARRRAPAAAPLRREAGHRARTEWEGPHPLRHRA